MTLYYVIIICSQKISLFEGSRRLYPCRYLPRGQAGGLDSRLHIHKQESRDTCLPTTTPVVAACSTAAEYGI